MKQQLKEFAAQHLGTLKGLGDNITITRSTVRMVYDPQKGESKKGREYERATCVLDNGMQLQSFKGDKYYEMFADENFKSGDIVTVAFEELHGNVSNGGTDTERANIQAQKFDIIGYEQGDRPADIPGWEASGKLREAKERKKQDETSKDTKSGGEADENAVDDTIG